MLYTANGLKFETQSKTQPFQMLQNLIFHEFKPKTLYLIQLSCKLKGANVHKCQRFITFEIRKAEFYFKFPISTYSEHFDILTICSARGKILRRMKTQIVLNCYI